ncbi:hypothetical protein BRD56_02100 [Thermoplasmatales archaeon SW_10_69_26]|nr:MAG: hypothetical protein BRD56_02100 [Thermoplasmatales archaeon SW_10_69_26]
MPAVSAADSPSGMDEALVFPPPEARDADGLVDHLEAATGLEMDWVLGLSNRSHLVGTITDETTLRFDVTAPDPANRTWRQSTIPMRGIPHNTYLEPEHLSPGAVLHTPDPERPAEALPAHTGVTVRDDIDRGEPVVDLVFPPGSPPLEGTNASQRVADLAGRLGIPATSPDDWTRTSSGSVHLYTRDETCTAYGCLHGRRTFLRCECTAFVAGQTPDRLPEGVEVAERFSWLNHAEVIVSPDDEILGVRSGPWIDAKDLDLTAPDDLRVQAARSLDARNVTFQELTGPQLVLVHPSPDTVLPTAAYAWKIEDGEGGRSHEIDQATQGRGGFFPASSLQNAATGETLDVRYDSRHIADPGYDIRKLHPVQDVRAPESGDLFPDGPDVNLTMETSVRAAWRIDRYEIPTGEPVTVPVRIDRAVQTTTLRYELSPPCCPDEEVQGTRVIETQAWLGNDTTKSVHLGENWTVRFAFEGDYTATPRLADGEGEVSPERLTWRSRTPANLTVAFAERTMADALSVAMPVWLNLTPQATLHHLPTGHRQGSSVSPSISVHDANATFRHRFEAEAKAPQIQIFPPGDNATATGQVPIEVDVYNADPSTSTVNLTIFALDGDQRRTVARPPLERSGEHTLTATWNATGADPGRYLVRVEADNGHRTSRAEKTVVVPDPSKAPVAEILSPEENETVSGEVLVETRAGNGNSEPSRLRLLVLREGNGSREWSAVELLETTREGEQRWAATWNTTGFDPGPYTLGLEVRDARQTAVDLRNVSVVAVNESGTPTRQPTPSVGPAAVVVASLVAAALGDRAASSAPEIGWSKTLNPERD